MTHTTPEVEKIVNKIADTIYVPFDTTMPGAIHKYGQIQGLNATIRDALTSIITRYKEELKELEKTNE